MSMKYMIFYLLKTVQDAYSFFIKLNCFVPVCRPSYCKFIMQGMIEFVNSNSVIPEQRYNYCLEYKGKCLFLQLKLACHNACILKIYNRQWFKLYLRLYFYHEQFVVIV